MWTPDREGTVSVTGKETVFITFFTQNTWGIPLHIFIALFIKSCMLNIVAVIRQKEKVPFFSSFARRVQSALEIDDLEYDYLAM
jgi:hypothetical protein